MPTFLGLAALVGFIALMMKAGAKSHGEAIDAAAKLPPSVKDAITNPHATKVELDTAASAAHAAGYPKLAEEIDRRAKKAPERKIGFPSPFRDVPHAAWTAFVKAMAVSTPEYVSPKGYYGMFLFGVRRLVDLGIMKSPKKTPTGWAAEWSIPKEKFLGSPRIQIAALGRSTQAYRKLILERYGKAIGLPAAGKSATMSGLLAVAHFAGGVGLGKWITDPSSRKPETTAAYLRANGIF
jgi:hypothetical protein